MSSAGIHNAPSSEKIRVLEKKYARPNVGQVDGADGARCRPSGIEQRLHAAEGRVSLAGMWIRIDLGGSEIDFFLHTTASSTHDSDPTGCKSSVLRVFPSIEG